MLVVLGWVGLPILFAAMIVFPAQDLGPALAAARGGGLHGQLIVREQYCDRRSCSGYYGDYSSDDGTVHASHVFLDGGPSSLRVGGSIEVTFFPHGRGPHVVYLAKGSHEWVLILGLLLAGVVRLVVWACLVLRRIWRGAW